MLNYIRCSLFERNTGITPIVPIGVNPNRPGLCHLILDEAGITTAQRASIKTYSERMIRDEAIRAGIVLFHASVEECLRDSARICFALRGYPEDDLRKMLSMKLEISELSRSIGRSVWEVISEAVAKRLEDWSMSSVDHVARLYGWLKFSTPANVVDLARIQELCELRHRVVHRAEHAPDDCDLRAIWDSGNRLAMHTIDLVHKAGAPEGSYHRESSALEMYERMSSDKT